MKTKYSNRSLQNFTLSRLLEKDIRIMDILEKHNIPYYSSPHLAFKEVLQDSLISFDTIVAEIHPILDTNDSKYSFEEKGLVEIINYLITVHHKYIREFFNQFESCRIPENIISDNKYKKPFFSLIELLKDELQHHLNKEEQILFPLIKYLVDSERLQEKPKTRNYGSINNPIRQMLFEHESALSIINQIKNHLKDISNTNDYSNWSSNLILIIKEFESDLHKHIHLENNVLFPKAIELENKLLNK
mgnify:CR=1 FL=1